MDGAGDARRITIHAPEDFAGMRVAGRLAAETLDMIGPHVKPGVTTGAIDKLCHEFILDHGAIPAPLNYRGYPKSVCISINHVVCHGIPGERRLDNGDILNIDVTVILNGWHGDTSRMYVAGTASTKARNLIDVTYESLMRGVSAGDGPVLRPGMFFTIEPMVNAGRPEVKILDDGWTAVTRDRSLSAQFEHMIGVTEDGCEIFTLSPAGLMKLPYA